MPRGFKRNFFGKRGDGAKFARAIGRRLEFSVNFAMERQPLQSARLVLLYQQPQWQLKRLID